MFLFQWLNSNKQTKTPKKKPKTKKLILSRDRRRQFRIKTLPRKGMEECGTGPRDVKRNREERRYKQAGMYSSIPGESRLPPSNTIEQK